MSNYRDLEAYCESQFIHGGPYWHIYTPGLETPVLFGLKEDYVFAMNLICQAASFRVPLVEWTDKASAEPDFCRSECDISIDVKEVMLVEIVTRDSWFGSNKTFQMEQSALKIILCSV